MAQVHVTIAGRSYRMACGDGEEANLEALAALLDGKIDEMRKAFGEIGDMRLQVMAALTLADEVSESRRRIEALRSEVAELKRAAMGESEQVLDTEQKMADFVIHASERLERLARQLTTTGARQDS